MRLRRFNASWRLVALCAVLVSAAGLVLSAGRGTARPPASLQDRQVDAARLMARSLETIRALRLAKGLPIDRELDPNETGLIGEEFTPLTTSLGDVEAKRTSTNPAFAALLVKYFREAGLSRGDVVAVGASGSFPAFLLATLSASRVLDLEPIVIYSVGASMYGANLPGFTFVEVLDGLRAAKLLPYRLEAVSAGGDGDEGKGVLFGEDGEALMNETRRSGLPIIDAASLTDSIRQRLRVYDQARGSRPIRCFVNIGGASASFGNTPASLALPSGLIRHLPEVPPDPTRGLVFEFASRGVPVVHLLFVRGLARDNQLPFDPVPFPPIGEGGVYARGPSGP
jgi:poly-gamma-glutamate system protein